MMVIGVAGYVLSQAVSADMLSSLERWLSDAQDTGRVVVGLLLMLVVLRIGRWIHKADTVVFTLH
jgi:fructose-specific phosphotransferase system IIC component